MSLLSRLFDFQAGTPAVADDVDAEFNQVIDLLNGTSTNKEVVLRSGSTVEPTLKVQKTSGSGNILDCLDSLSVSVATVSNSGQLTLAEDTLPPLVVASDALVTNLNADQLDGRQSTGFIWTSGQNSQTILGSSFTTLIISHPSANNANLEFDQSDGVNRYFLSHTSGDLLQVRHDDGVTNFSQMNFNPTADSVALPGATKLFLSGDPLSDLEAATKQYVDSEIVASIDTLERDFIQIGRNTQQSTNLTPGGSPPNGIIWDNVLEKASGSDIVFVSPSRFIQLPVGVWLVSLRGGRATFTQTLGSQLHFRVVEDPQGTPVARGESSAVYIAPGAFSADEIHDETTDAVIRVTSGTKEIMVRTEVGDNADFIQGMTLIIQRL